MKTMKAIGTVATLLKAASELPEIFSAEELVVAAWLKDKDSLGLKGYEALYPNSNKIFSTLMGKNGLERRGYLKKVGPKLYSLMPAGKALVIPNGKPLEVRASKGLEAQFLGYFDSPTKHKVAIAPETVMLVDALSFWKILPDDKNIDQKLTAVGDCLSNLEALLREKKDVTLSNGLVLAAKDIQSVRRTHEWLQEKFRRHLNLLIHRNK